MSQAEFLKALITISDQSTITYNQYLNAGKTFQFAQVLKLYNSKALKLLKENKALLQKNLQKDAQSLIIHYTEWSGKWDQPASEKVHHLNDVFVFANDITFPKLAAQHFEEAYKELK